MRYFSTSYMFLRDNFAVCNALSSQHGKESKMTTKSSEKDFISRYKFAYFVYESNIMPIIIDLKLCDRSTSLDLE